MMISLLIGLLAAAVIAFDVYRHKRRKHRHEFELLLGEDKKPKWVWVYDDIGVTLYRAQGCALRICKTCTRQEVCPLRGDHPDGDWFPVIGIQETESIGPPMSTAQFENGASLQVRPLLAEGRYRVNGVLH